MRLIMLLFFLSIVVISFSQSYELESIPYQLNAENQAKEISIGKNSLQLTAGAKTDLFISPDGGHKINNSPRLLFKPDSCFILTSKIGLDFNNNWDAGVLLLYNDSSHFAKFCFESDFQGTPRIVTVVCNETGDDCNSIEINDKHVYFRIIGSVTERSFLFFYSSDAKSWYPIRSFKLDNIDYLRIGFNAQSPIGDECKVQFSEIDLQQRKPINWWEGN